MPTRSTPLETQGGLQTCLMRVAAGAFVQCSFLLAIAAAVSGFSGREAAPYFAMAVLAYGVCGGVALGRGINREIKSDVAEAANLYSAALVNYLVSYAACLAYTFAETSTLG